MAAVNNVRVLIVADDPLARAGLATLLSTRLESTVMGQVGGDTNLTEAVQLYRPDVVLWDLGLSPSVSLERLANARDSGVPIVALLAEPGIVSDVWAAGARGLILREAEVDSLTAALQAAADNLTVLGPGLASALLPARTIASRPPVEELTPRERQVLQLLAEGQSNKEIARRLGISDHTVKFHVNAILGKLDVQSRTEAVVRATRLGLILL
jgi:DNA-binding NarL/FixJ family response regulator